MTDQDFIAATVERIVNSRLEPLLAAMERVERKIDKEISDLKTEQIGDLRKAVERLADDQRRLWETALQSQGSKYAHQVWITLLASLASGAIVWVIAHFVH